MTGATPKGNDTTGDRIMQAVQEERARWMTRRPTIKIESGFTALPFSQPTFTLTITGGDGDALQALGMKLARDAMENLPPLPPAHSEGEV